MSFLAGYVLVMTVNSSHNRGYNEGGFQKERLEMKCG